MNGRKRQERAGKAQPGAVRSSSSSSFAGGRVLLLHHQQHRPWRVAAENCAKDFRREHAGSHHPFRNSVVARDSRNDPIQLAFGQNPRTPLACRCAHPDGWSRARVQSMGRNTFDFSRDRLFGSNHGSLRFPFPFWALPTLFLTGPAAAASIAFINSVGNLGGFAGPYVIGFLTDKTGTYQAGIFYLVASGLVGGLLVLALRSGAVSERAPAAGVSASGVVAASLASSVQRSRDTLK